MALLLWPGLADAGSRRRGRCPAGPRYGPCYYNEDINRSPSTPSFSSTGGLSPQTGVDSNFQMASSSTSSFSTVLDILDGVCHLRSTLRLRHRVRLRQLFHQKPGCSSSQSGVPVPKAKRAAAAAHWGQCARPTHLREFREIDKAEFLRTSESREQLEARKHSHFPPTHFQMFQSSHLSLLRLSHFHLQTIQDLQQRGFSSMATLTCMFVCFFDMSRQMHSNWQFFTTN